MDLQTKLEKLEDLMDIDSGSLTPDLLLSDIEEWDSLSALS